MRRIITSCFLLISLTLSANSIDCSHIKNLPHPRLFASDEEFASMMQRVAANTPETEAISTLHNSIIAAADQFIAEPLPLSFEFDEANYRLANNKNSLAMLSPAVYAWRATHEEKYAVLVSRIVDIVCREFTTWNAKKHYLDTACLMFAMTLAYDWMYDYWDAPTREMIRQNILDKGLTCYKGLWWNRVNTNWNQVCYCGIVNAAVAVCDAGCEDICAEAIAQAVDANPLAQKASYSPDGNYPEGYTYFVFGTNYECLLLSTLEHTFGTAFGLDQVQGFDRAPEMILNSVGPSGLVWNFFDNGTREYNVMSMWYFARRFSRPDFVVKELQRVREGFYQADHLGELAPLYACIMEDYDPKDITFPAQSPLYHGRGITPIAIVHTDRNNPALDRFMAVKAGSASANHGHMDVGSFVYDAHGIRWACDPGDQEYAPVEAALKAAKFKGGFWDMKQKSPRWKVWRMTNYGHNVLTVNDSLHVMAGRAVVDSLYDSPDGYGMSMDMSSVFKGQLAYAHRIVLVDKKGHLVVTDEIEAPSDKSAKVDWRMNTHALVKTSSSCQRLFQDGREAVLKVSSSDCAVRPTYRTWPAQGTQVWDEPDPDATMAGYSVMLSPGQRVVLTTKLKTK